MNFTPFISISSFISEISHVTTNIYCNVSHFVEPHLSLPWWFSIDNFSLLLDVLKFTLNYENTHSEILLYFSYAQLD